MNRNYKFFISILIFFTLMPFVVGANILDQILGNPAFKDINIGQTYTNYYAFIDSILYFILFIGIAQAALRDKFKEFKTIPIVLGIILAIGMSVFELNTKWNLGLLSGYAAIIFFSLLIIGPFMLMKNMGAKPFYAFAISYFFTFSMLIGTGLLMNSEFTRTLGQDSMVMIILWILYVVSIIGAIIGIIDMVKSRKSGDYALSQGTSAGKMFENSWNTPMKKIEKAEKKVSDIEQQMAALEGGLKKLESIEETIDQRDLSNRAAQLKLIQELETALTNSWKLQEGIQKVYPHLSEPAYAEYKSRMDEYVSSLNTNINSLRNVIEKLKQNLITYKDVEKNELSVEKSIQEYENKITEQEKLMNELLENDFKYLKDIDEDQYNILKAEHGSKIREELQGGNLDPTVMRKFQLVPLIKSIDSLDKENMTYIDKIIDLATKDSTKNISKLNEFSFRLVPQQSLALIYKYIKNLKENMNKIIRLKEEDAALLKERDTLLNNKMAIIDKLKIDFQKDAREAIEKTINDYNMQEGIYIKYAVSIERIIDSILAKAEKANAGQMIVLGEDNTALEKLAQEINIELKGKRGRLIKEIKESLTEIITGIKTKIQEEIFFNKNPSKEGIRRPNKKNIEELTKEKTTLLSKVQEYNTTIKAKIEKERNIEKANMTQKRDKFASVVMGMDTSKLPPVKK